MYRSSYLISAFAIALMMVAAPALADNWLTSWYDSRNLSIGGFLRLESAYSTTKSENPNNQTGNPYNKVSVPRQAFVPPHLPGTITSSLLGGLDPGPVGTWSTLPLPTAVASDAQSPGVRGIPYKTNDFNMHYLRGDLSVSYLFSPSLRLRIHARGIYDPGHYDEFDANTVDNLHGGIGGDPALYSGKPNYFEYRVEGGGDPMPLEWSGRNYMVDLPAFVLDYSNGPFNVRVGNQAIAWGHAIFFRVIDIANGLDLRRHSLLDYAQEEFSDKRVPSLAVRGTWQATSHFLLDGFVEKFQPTIYGNPNTQYNVIPAQFTVHDLYKEGGYDNKLNEGVRLTADYGQWGFQLMMASRYNPLGVFRWTQSGVNKSLPNTPLSTGFSVNQTEALQGHPSTGALLAQSAFEVGAGGVCSANEWFDYAGQVRLNSITGLNASINEFPAAQQLYASPVNNYQDAFNELNTFFIAAGGCLRGHIAREYFREHVFGAGASYVVEGSPGSLLDQLIINFEGSYTPNRTFTNTSLSRNYVHKDSTVLALVLEKYYRFSQSFPATYFVFQYMHRNVDDLFGRLLDGYGGSINGPGNGIDGANYFVFALQQPFHNDIVRAAFAALYDSKGSLLLQPGVEWKPSSKWTLGAFYTFIESDVNGGNPNDTLLSTIGWGDEITVRLAYNF